MPEAVVDSLEPVQVEEQQSDEARSLGSKRERVLHSILEQRAVRQPGQVVMECLHHEALFELATRRDVGQRPGHPAEQAGIVVDRPSMRLHPDVAAVAPDKPELVAVLLNLTLGNGLRQVAAELAIVRVDEAHHRPTDGVDHRVIGELLPRVIEERQSTLGVDAKDDLPHTLHDRGPERRCHVSGLDDQTRAGDGEDEDEEGPCDDEPSQLPRLVCRQGALRGQRDLRSSVVRWHATGGRVRRTGGRGKDDSCAPQLARREVQRKGG